MIPVETAATSRPRILIIDDSALVRLYYREVLGKAEFDVDQAMNGIEAMERALAQSFDLLIVDVNMPKMDGLSFLRLLRQSDSEAATLPALVITTEAAAEDVRHARAAGANFYLVKPVSESALCAHVAVLTGVRR